MNCEVVNVKYSGTYITEKCLHFRSAPWLTLLFCVLCNYAISAKMTGNEGRGTG